MLSTRQRVILGLALLGALTCVVILALRISAKPPSSWSSPEVEKATKTETLDTSLPLWVHVRPAWPEDDYPRGPIRPGEPPRTLPPMLLDKDPGMPGMPGATDRVREVFPQGK